MMQQHSSFAWFLIALFLALPVLVHAQEEEDPWEGKVFMKVEEGEELSVEALLQNFSMRLGVLIIPDKQIERIRIKFLREVELNYLLLKEVLLVNEIELIPKRVGEDLVIEAVLQRNLSKFVGPNRFIQEREEIPDTDEIITATFPIEHADANGIFAAIRGLITRDPRRVGNIVYVRGSEVLIISDLSSNVKYYAQLIAALDVKAPEMTIATLSVRHALAEDIAQIANELVRAQLQAKQQQGQQAAQQQPQIIADPRTNKVIVLSLPKEIEELKDLVRELDIRVPEKPVNFHYYQCQNADATALADKLNELFGGPVSGASQRDTARSRRGSSRSSRSSRSSNQRSVTPRTTTSVPTNRESLNPAEDEIQTRVVADEPTNSLLIQADPQDYQTILSLLAKLDKKRRRVLIEAQVWEISVTDEWTIAVESAFFDESNQGSVRGAAGSGNLGNFGLQPVTGANNQITDVNTVPFPSALAGGLGGGAATLPNGLSALIFKDDYSNIPVLLQAFGADSDNNLLTTPFAMTDDNEEATFTILDRFPFRVTTSTSAVANAGFDFAEASSTLTIEPRISSESTLNLFIDLTIESFTGRPPETGAPPPSNSRQYTGVVTVPNREYVVFGGLERERVSWSKSKIPFLGDIPLLGYLFRSTRKETEKTRIYIFVRPIIMTGAKDDDFATMKTTSDYLHTAIEANSLFKSKPLVPDELLDAEHPSLKGILYNMFGTDAYTPFEVELEKLSGSKKER